MTKFNQNREELIQNGFSITQPVFSNEERLSLINLIEGVEKSYAIRQLVNRIPEVQEVVFENKEFKELYSTVCNEDYFLSKAIFFNKPAKSNWFVSHHQDLSISVKDKMEIEGYTNWTNKNGQLGVIPPKEILENTITFRIHLDNTNNTNGALRVLKNTHKKGIIRIDESFRKEDLGEEELCIVKQGGIMLMNPLLLHASSRSVSEHDRRVIHLEFCNQEIPVGWLERKEVV
ncbi:phytanoyl-CoA dioxygenase family protein [Tenacibaculum ovolyticum]|uniref:phytanoyl-CoA dioxygenase family protein n=1 Tax=Tenacibaculum ovolyticum TaxID=104270 RepID=UPI0007ED0FD2|nr:phytanoyl-CoA dioxygenase family protein [Tenacibaculum ovolyticum]